MYCSSAWKRHDLLEKRDLSAFVHVHPHLKQKILHGWSEESCTFSLFFKSSLCEADPNIIFPFVLYPFPSPADTKCLSFSLCSQTIQIRTGSTRWAGLGYGARGSPAGASTVQRYTSCFSYQATWNIMNRILTFVGLMLDTLKQFLVNIKYRP